ncbi:MAG: HNH endonuclease, partial [Erysipelotrichaceae bacterium]|nr:HNH endonuclease [Erysipelotrichaceae bacterium]
NPLNKPQVNHIDGDKSNNHISNLEWCTPRENLIHAEASGLRNHPSGKEDKRSIQIKQIDDLTGEVVAIYGGLREMERETGFSRTVVSRVLDSPTRRAYGWKWERC